MLRGAIAGAAALMILTGCTGPGATDPAPTVTVTAEPNAAGPNAAGPDASGPGVGDELTPLAAWDICFAHTTTQVKSDLTEWSPYAPGHVEQPSVGAFIVTIENVRSGGDSDDFGTVTCRVEGRVGGAIIVEWARN
jgi:hypothetical protein